MTHHVTDDVDRLLASLARTIARLQPATPCQSARRRGPLPSGRRRNSLRTHRFGHESGTGATGAGDAAASDVLAAVRETAGEVHERLGHDHDVFAVELLGATGAGKTALLESLLAADGPAPFARERVGVVTGDVAGTDDADRLRNRGVPVVNVTTGRDCHLDPERVDSALDEFDLGRLEVLFVENVGNMVCPAEFPLGTDVRAVVVSPTEGDDVVRKHPMLFQVCDLAVVNKLDVAAAVGADVARMADDIDHVAPETPVVRTSAETGAGIDELATWLVDRRRERLHAHHG